MRTFGARHAAGHVCRRLRSDETCCPPPASVWSRSREPFFPKGPAAHERGTARDRHVRRTLQKLPPREVLFPRDSLGGAHAASPNGPAWRVFRQRMRAQFSDKRVAQKRPQNLLAAIIERMPTGSVALRKG